MHSTRRMLSSLFLMFLFGLVYAAYSECPPCFKDLVPMAGHGPAPDGSGRRVINVAIDKSWDDTPGHTNPNFWNGIFGCPTCAPPIKGAIDKWNDKPGGSYFFKPVNGTGESPDIIINKGSMFFSNSCACTTISQFPYLITFPPGSETLPQDALASNGAHELGHPIGLADTSQCNSIMNGNVNDCAHSQTSNVQDADVQSSNQNINASTRTNCSSSVSGAHPNSSYGYQSYSPQGGGTCSTVLLTTDYYYCNELGCTYLGSSSQWLGFYCR